MHRKKMLDFRNGPCDTDLALHCSISFAAARRRWGRYPKPARITAMRNEGEDDPMAGTTNVTKLAGKATSATTETVRKAALQSVAHVPQVPAPAPIPAISHAATENKTMSDQMTKMTDGMQKSTEDAVEFGRGNFEAFTKATQAYVTGLQDLSRQAFAMAQGFGEQAVENAKALSSVKSLKEASELQASFARSAIEKSVAETTKLNEAAFKLAEQASAPLAARWTLAVEKFTKAAPRV
ncbi:phasin family protein [Teichococcus aerophilus]|nr:phasin family protein [Pseudoroseomonas aerophila]